MPNMPSIEENENQMEESSDDERGSPISESKWNGINLRKMSLNDKNH